MRSLAAIAFVWAALDAPAPWLDRAGLVGLALALLALAIPGRPRAQRPTLFGPPQPAGEEPNAFHRRMTAALAEDIADDF